ncbi:zinc finger protein 670-like isoform X2 [Maniola hyperantus]
MECCICATCVCRLREASDFRKQVLQSQQLFVASRHKENAKNVKLEVKMETTCDSDIHDNVEDAADHNDDSDIETKVYETIKTVDVTKIKSLKRTTNVMQVEQSLSTADKIRRLYTTMKRSINQAVPPAVKQTSNAIEPIDPDEMVHTNTVIIVTNTYACPFRNRISFYYCFYCNDAQFTNPTELREHTLTHDPKLFEKKLIHYNRIPLVDITRIDCRLCPEKIDDVESFKTHITSKHKKLLYPVTNEFLKFKLTPNNLTCTECNAIFTFFDALKKHMVDHFGTHTCDVCGTCFLEPGALRAHIRTHNKVDANYPCEICGKNLKSKYSMGLHVATVHEKKPTINCYKCDAAFLSYALRNRHLIEAHGDKRTFPCRLCGKVFRVRKNLAEHHRRCHVRAYNHQCVICTRSFYLPSTLQAHMATHTGERNFKCKHCDKSYLRLKSLNYHMRSHKR